MKTFSAREAVWLQELDGIELAGFRRRAFAFCIDWILISILLSVVLGVSGFAYYETMKAIGHPAEELQMNSDSVFFSISPEPAKPGQSGIHYHLGVPDHEAHGNESARTRIAKEAIHIVTDILVPVLYFGLFLWRWNGRTPGKRLMKIRVVSLVHRHMNFWHSVERALGYGAAALELGFGFLQYFIHPYRRCAQDRLAETIVVTEAGYQQVFLAPRHPTL